MTEITTNDIVRGVLGLSEQADVAEQEVQEARKVIAKRERDLEAAHREIDRLNDRLYPRYHVAPRVETSLSTAPMFQRIEIRTQKFVIPVSDQFLHDLADPRHNADARTRLADELTAAYAKAVNAELGRMFDTATGRIRVPARMQHPGCANPRCCGGTPGTCAYHR